MFKVDENACERMRAPDQTVSDSYALSLTPMHSCHRLIAALGVPAGQAFTKKYGKNGKLNGYMESLDWW